MSGKRGGRRARRFASKEGLSEINHNDLAELMAKLAPKASSGELDFALAIVVKGIEMFREHAPSSSALTGTVQKNRRALEKFKKGKTGARQLPFNSFAKVGGQLYGAAADGIYLIKDDPETAYSSSTEESYGNLEPAIADSLRAYAVIHQRGAGFKHINPNIPFIGPTADVLLDGIAHPRDWEAELAGLVYLAIVKGLRLKASMSEASQLDTMRMRNGANYCRLLNLALHQGGIEPPKEKMRPLMLKGKKEAQELTAVAIEHGDGRTFSLFEMMFPGRA